MNFIEKMALSMKESEIPKYLAEELSKEPYNLNLNLISFTSLQGDALMRVKFIKTKYKLN